MSRIQASEFKVIYEEATNLAQLGKYREAILLLDKYKEDENAAKVLAICNYNIAQKYDMQMEFNTAYKYYSEAYKLIYALYKKYPVDKEYQELIGTILFAIGNLFGSLEKHDKAINYLEQARKIFGIRYDILKYLGHEYYFNEQTKQGEIYLSEYATSNNLNYENLINETKLLQYHKYLGKVRLLAGTSGHDLKRI